MIKLISKIIGIGLLVGLVISAVIMLLASMLFYVFAGTDSFLPSIFMYYAAWIALIAGLSGTFGWYFWVLYFVVKYFNSFLKQKKDNKNG